LTRPENMNLIAYILIFINLFVSTGTLIYEAVAVGFTYNL